MTMDFAMDQCLQSDARQSHSLGADWIVKQITRQERNAYLAVFYMSNSTCTLIVLDLFLDIVTFRQTFQTVSVT